LLDSSDEVSSDDGNDQSAKKFGSTSFGLREVHLSSSSNSIRNVSQIESDNEDQQNIHNQTLKKHNSVLKEIKKQNDVYEQEQEQLSTAAKAMVSATISSMSQQYNFNQFSTELDETEKKNHAKLKRENSKRQNSERNLSQRNNSSKKVQESIDL